MKAARLAVTRVAEGSFGVVKISVVPVASGSASTEVTFALGSWSGSFKAGTFVATSKFDEVDRWAGFTVDGLGIGLDTVFEVAQTDIAMMVLAMAGVEVMMATAEMFVARGIAGDETVAGVAEGSGRDGRDEHRGAHDVGGFER